MKKFVAPLLCTVIAVSAVGAMTGCTASASLNAGGADTPPPPAPPPPPPPPPAPAAEPKQELKVEGNKISIPGAIVFKTGSAELDPVSDPILAMVKDYLDAKPKVTKLRIEGHTDSDGDDKANLELSAKRTLSVAKWLVGKGIDCKRLVPVGFGETKPVADNKTTEGKAQNRRVDFINAELSGKAIMGMPVDAGAPKVLDACAP